MKKKILIVLCCVVLVGGSIFGLLYYRNMQKQLVTKGRAPATILSPKPVSGPMSYIDQVLSKMTLRDEVASLFITDGNGADAQTLGQFMDTYKLGGFILMGANIPSTDAALQAETAALRGSDPKLPRLVATDQEGGTVRRLLGDVYASALTLKYQPTSATTTAFTQRSTLVQSVGITLNFGIIADTTADPNSFIFDRVLGTTPSAAADRVIAAVDATKGKTLSTLKHFPGHGETEADSHLTIPTTSISYDQWLQRDEPPFKSGIDAGADVVMVGHLRYAAIDSLPASLSSKWHDILRNTLGFKGVIITDALDMLQDSGDPSYTDPVHNAIMALQAGNTMLLYILSPSMNNDPNALVNGVVSTVESGSISKSVIDQDARQALELRSESALLVR